MLKDLQSDQKTLAEFMSEISEMCYNAGWEHNLEFVLWHAVVNGQREYGRCLISTHIIDKLKQLSDDCGCWIHFGDEMEETAIPMDKWKDIYHAKVLTNPKVLTG